MQSAIIAIPRETQPKLSENAMLVLSARYLRRDAHGSVAETPPQMFDRVARAVSEAELIFGSASNARLWEERFPSCLVSRSAWKRAAGRYWPSSRPACPAGFGPKIGSVALSQRSDWPCPPMLSSIPNDAWNSPGNVNESLESTALATKIV